MCREEMQKRWPRQDQPPPGGGGVPERHLSLHFLALLAETVYMHCGHTDTAGTVGGTGPVALWPTPRAQMDGLTQAPEPLGVPGSFLQFTHLNSH